MQETAFRALGIKAFYLPFEVSRTEMIRLMKRRKKLLLDGFNVTVPYKELVLRHLDGASPEARAIGAVNTVVRRGRRWLGFNTDASGFVAALTQERKFSPRGKKVLILGAGGSARAVAYGLARAGVRSIMLANRTPARARKIASDFRRLFPRIEFAGVSLAGIPSGRGREKIGLVVNATSVGLKSKDRPLVNGKEFPNRKSLFVDLIYRPAETKFLKSARRSGHRTLNGLGMLAYQGAAAFELWTGRRAPLEVMRRALKERLRPSASPQ
jgi:shikimate dehydrogenase